MSLPWLLTSGIPYFFQRNYANGKALSIDGRKTKNSRGEPTSGKYACKKSASGILLDLKNMFRVSEISCD